MSQILLSMSPTRLYIKKNKLLKYKFGEHMDKLTIVSWRDIPAQLLIGSGRNAVKLKLSERFEKAIDRCAMKVGAKDSESYLQDWQKKIVPLQSSGAKSIEMEAELLEKNYTSERLKALILNNGWD